MASKKTNPKKAQAATETTKGAAAKTSALSKNAKAAAPKKKDDKKGSKPGIVTRVRTYFKNVRSELKRVVWPTKPELIKYTGAVLGMLIFFGIMIAVVDAVIVPVLYAFSGLR